MTQPNYENDFGKNLISFLCEENFKTYHYKNTKRHKKFIFVTYQLKGAATMKASG